MKLHNIQISGSIKNNGEDLTQISSSVATTTLNISNRIGSLESKSGSLISGSSQIIYSGITGIPSGIVSGSAQLTGSYDARYVLSGSITQTTWDNIASKPTGIVSGSIQVDISATTGYASLSSSISGGISTLSGSVATTTSGLSSSIGSLSSSIATTTLNISSSLDNISGSIMSSIGSLSSSVATTTLNLSSSVATTTSGLSSSIGSLSSSVATTDAGIKTRLNTIEGVTGSYATTGSNIYQGNQTITGSLFISQNLVVQGSSSITYVTSSQLRVDDNIITLNTSTPGQRFGGIEVYDSGSVTQATGSILWDSVNNRWVYQQSSEATYGGGILMSGPRSSGSLGSELTLTSNRVAKSVGGDHLNDTNITDDGTTVSINSNSEITGTLKITGTIVSTGTSIFSGSGQVIASLPAGTVSSSAQTIANLPSGTVSGSSQVLAGTTIHSGSFFNGITVVSGSGQIDGTAITNKSITIAGTVTSLGGSITAATILTSTGVWSGSAQLPSGLVSGSSQITLSSTTGFGTYLDQAVKSGSTVTFSTVTATTFTGALSGNASTASSVNFANIAAGTRNNYTLDFKPSTSSYAGFRFSKSTSADGAGDAGYLLIRGTDDSDIYTAEGITLVADLGWLTLAQRTTASKGVRIMTGSPTASTRVQVLTDGTIKLSSLTSNGFVKTSGSDGTLSVDTTTYFSISSQVTLSSTTGFGTYLNQAVLTTSSPQFANIGIGAAARSYYYSSANRYGVNFGTYGDAFTLSNQSFYFGANIYYDNGWFRGPSAAPAAMMELVGSGGGVNFYTVATGTAGTSVSPTNTVQFTSAGGISTLAGVTFGTSLASGACLTLHRVGGQPTIKGATANGGDGQIVIDGASNSANVYLNNYVSSSVYLATGGGTVYSASLLPHSNNAYNLGASGTAWANIYTNDLHLSNMGKPEGNDIDGTSGDWTIQEGAEQLYIINNNNGKKYKINLTEII